MPFRVILTLFTMPGPPGELMIREKNNFFKEWHQNSPTYGHVTNLFLELKFQHKGYKQTKKAEFSAKSCSFICRNRFRQQDHLNATLKRTKENWTDLSLLGPTFTLLRRKGKMNIKELLPLQVYQFISVPRIANPTSWQKYHLRWMHKSIISGGNNSVFFAILPNARL